MPKATPAHDLALCVAPGCDDAPMRLAPIPMCGLHVRRVYEFADGLIDARAHVEQARLDTRPEPAPPHVDGSGWVYFVRDGDLVKIGFSTWPPARFKTLKAAPSDVLGTMPGTRDDERRCHAAFAHLREHGEYFRAEPDLIAFINALHSGE